MDFLRKYVFHNFGLKLLSLVVAVLLWLAVTRDPVAEIALNVPIEFHNAPEHLEISSETIPQVLVRVRGPVREVRDLSPSEVHAIIDLARVQPGERTYDLAPKRIRVPDGVEVVQAVPSQIRINFDRRESRQVEVKPRVIGTFASGYRIEKVVPVPQSVTIVGPAGHVQAVETAITDPVDASGVVGVATFVTHAYVSDPLVRLADPSPIRVTVTTEKQKK
ncbi:MAG TPA: CdaR family protein [Terriglobales bacterium]|jgi:YbbR domain-containing protein|nr:CdaR family protein [Terriglobales bacterium]